VRMEDLVGIGNKKVVNNGYNRPINKV